jgi:hypothetical protein
MTINPIGAANPNQAIDPTTFQTQMQQALAPVAQLFGESTDQLMSELSSANTSLSALASQKGVSQSDLVGAITQGLQQTAAEKGQSPSDAQLTNIANRIANHKHGGHHHHGGGSTASTTSATTNSIPTDSTQAMLALLGAQDPSNVDQTL